ncbi:hypothetical protein ACFPRL_29780 [Pseudoclavibacter helvolus]
MTSGLIFGAEDSPVFCGCGWVPGTSSRYLSTEFSSTDMDAASCVFTTLVIAEFRVTTFMMPMALMTNATTRVTPTMMRARSVHGLILLA